MFQRKRINIAALLALGSVLAGTAMAQETLQRVEVTGSRIKTIDTEGQSPIVVMTAESIKADGIRTAEGLLNNLPQVFADFGGAVSNGATGTATVNLRNLGSSRTLVLINGRRMPAGSPRNVAADLNQIPVSMIQRVEVLTGGASAVYGADAVAGVVNFILKENFQGVEFDGSYQFFNHQQGNAVGDVVTARGFPVPGNKSADGKVKEFSVTVGGNFADNKGNAVLNFTAHREDALLQSERDFSSCSLGIASGGKAFNCGGSSTNATGRFLLNQGSFTVADANGGVRGYKAATDAFNFGPINYFQRPSDRYSVTASAHYDINDMARVYTQLGFHDDHTVAQIAPSGIFFGNSPNIHYENPLLSDAWKATLAASNALIEDADGKPAPLSFNKPGDIANIAALGRRNVEGGGRQDDIRHTSYRSIIGVKGDIGAWSYDVFGQIGRVVYQETYLNDFSNARISRALDVVSDASGKPVCRTKLDGTDPNCVPYNIWKLGGVTPEALKYISTPGFQKGFTNQGVFGGSVAGDLTEYGLKLPTANSGVGVAFGVEHRYDQLELSVDNAFSTGDLAGQGGPTKSVAGRYSVDDIYGEVRVPLVDRKPLIYALNLSTSYRHSKYSTGNNTNTYGTGLDWSPIKEVKFRGSYQQAVRSPNVVELFTPGAIGLFNADTDPCSGEVDPKTGTVASGMTAAQCARTGVTANQYGKILDSSAGQFNGFFSGNEKLKPETSRSLTFGLVATPIKDLNVSLDYFNIEVKDAIGSVPATTSLNQCLETGDPYFCNKIHRDKLGSIWISQSGYIDSMNENLAKFKTKGLDVGLDYALRMGELGRLDASLLGTYLQEFSNQTAPGLGSYDCAGLYGSTCGTPAPKWRHKLRGTWATPWNVNATLTWRHFGSVDVDTTSSNSQLSGTVNEITKTFGAQNYLDLAMSYKLTKVITLAASINNLLDKDPPVGVTGAPFGNGNTYPVVYDAMGRRITLGLNAKF
ncbi:TonB-dependent receptor [Paucibacter sp. TC2R-5]|uniref:TonB-dependent receptor domain-containing protein n=1 Tax=Paucibacter sp. TC2R-5 TaxID=2893555 RepID=UPI0021E488D7|nr:TonB-dependent receptor [Paucibacter sp. TC2R-5]MCV2357834.1 TonB-dependent receptor [Paucibacter sp. TC2R-5]